MSLMNNDSAVKLISSQLGAFASQDNFWSLFDVAFGKDYNQAVARRLKSQWQAGDFSQFPKVAVVSSSILVNANGAYAASTNTIYLADAFVDSASPNNLISVLLEEYGHFVDAQINQIDSAGDEGAIFASLVMGENLSQLQLSQLMSEDDSATILLNGQTIQIEKSGTPGFTIIPLTSLVTTEAGGTAKVSVQLNTQPTNSVTIPLRSDNVKEGVLDKSSLTFTPTNWNVAQVLTITGVDDQTSDGDIAYNIISDPVISNDLIYRELGKNSGVYSFINQDNEVNGNLIIFNPITPLVTTESGGTAKFSVSLGRQPSSNVTIPVIISNIKEGILDKSSLTFTSTNWNVPQVLTVTGVDDLIDDSDVSYNLDVSPAVSNDPSYQGLVPAYYGAKITNNDDDQTGISVTPLTPLVVTEDGGTAQFTLRLNSQPVSPVKVELSLNRSLGILDNYTLIFTSENWNQPQPVTVTGVLDDVVEGGDYPSTISISAVNQDYELARAEGRYVSNSPNGDGYGIGAVSTVVNVLKKSIVYQYVPFTGGYVSQLRQDNNFANTLSVPGTSGNDRFYSYTGYIDNQFIQINKLFGQGGSDWLSGSFSSENPDELYGQEGNDYLIGGSGDKLFGGTGNDFYKVFYSNVIVSDDSGIDTVIFYVENYTLPPTIENLELSYHVFNGIGNDLNNYIIGNDQGNSLFGRGGNDTIDGKSGNDTIDGGDGDDTIDGKSGNDTIDGGDGDDTIVGGYDDDILKGGVGNDVLYGRRSLENSARENDILEGGEGDDILYGQGGNDKLYGGDGNDKLYGGEGDDILEGGSGNDILYDLFGKNSLKGGLGDDEYTLGVTNISFGTTPEGNTIDDEGGTNDTLKFLTLENLEGLFTWDLTSYTPRNSSFSQSANRNLFGVKADDTTLWVDTNQDNVIDANNDLEIKNYYKKIVDAEGKVSYSIGVGYIENMKFVVEEDKEPPDTKPLLIKAINGKFNDNDGDGTWNANGTILIGRQDGIEQMLTVDDANAEISQQSIKFTNGTVYSSIFQIPTPLFTGNFTIPIGTSATSAFQEISSLPNEFSPAGLDLSLSKFNLAKNQIELQGKVTLPINFDSVVIDITGGNNFVIAEDGFGLTGANIQLPNTNFAYENIVKIQATNLSLGWEKDFFKIQGSVEGSSPFLRNAKFNADFSGNNYIKISDNGSNESRVDVIGSLAVENLSLGKWGINQASVFINTVDGNITGSADVKLPWGLISGLKGTLGFQKSQATWELDSAAIDISGDFPLPILPVVSLTKLGGKVSNLSENATSPIIFEGNATLDVKPLAKLTTVLPDWVGKQFTVNSVATFTGGSKIDENSLKMNGTADILGGLLAQVKVTDLDIDWNKLSLTSKVDASILNGLVSLNGGLSADSNFNFTAFGEGQVTLPSTTFFKLFGLDGKEILSAGIGVKYINNDIFSDDSVAGWGSAGFLDKKVGFRVFLDGKTDIIGAKEIESYKPTTVPAEGSIPLDITANNNQGNLPDDSTLYQILESALPNAYSYLQQFATSSEFVTTMNLAFDSNWNKTVGYQIAQTWAVGNFDNIPIIKMISAANIGGANAAFADSTNTIYIAKEYLAYHSSNLDSLTDVLLEEIGHWVDAQVNSIDTLGDEGAIFSSLLHHQTLSNQQLAQLKAEDDTLTITLDGINTQLNLNSSQQDSFSIASNTPWFLLAINWENGTSNVPFEIQAPDGKIYTEADLIGSQTISIVNELSSSTRKVLRIDNPDAGIWKIKLPDTTNLGNVGFSSLGGLEAPTITIGSLQQEINSSNVVINYDINNIDANAQISFYYDVDNNGFNGDLIGVVNPQSEGLGKYTWNTQGVNLGNYYIYALVSDNNRIPTSAYSLNGITLTSTPVNHPPTLQNKILKQTAPENSVFSFTIPTNTFNDIDAGDVLTYSATLESGNALPTWLSFNATTRTFSGTPTNDNVGSLNVKVTTTDKAGANVSDIFAITVENVNDAPVLSNAIADQNAKQGTAFNFQVPSNTFTDIDAGDVLSYSATLENGDALPSWLTFNSTTRTFSGTPTNDNVGNLNIKAIATDKVGENVSDIFTITVENVNDAPTLANAIADQNAKQGNAFNFQIPTNTFTDIDAGDVLGYSATLENGTALPSWLTFNPTTRTFSGTPTNDNVGSLNVKAIATDKAGATVSDIFVITVENINDAPTLENTIADQNTKQDNLFNFQIPTNTFTDIDAGDILTYSATLENGNVLPSWLTFNSTTRTFSGTPTNDNVGNLNIKAIATDKTGATVSDIFVIAIENVNNAPIVANLIADQNAKQGTAFNFQIPTNTFTDIDAGDILTYSATLENGNALPNWLTFNSTTRTFSGTPTNDNVGNLNVKVAATDKTGASVNDTFTIKVQNVNTAPILKNQLVDQTVKVNSTFTFTLPKDTFSDPDAVNPYKNLVIFGDSLSDTGNAYKASGNTFPPSPNYQGRLSNGLIWVDYFAPDLQFTNPSIQNYAFLGANTGVSNTFGQITVPGLLTQIQQFKTVNTNSIGKDGLYVIWAGANDFLNLATDPTQAVTNAVTNISSAITTLAGLGAKEIVVGNLTDLGATPLSIANNNVANARAISIGFNAALTQALTNLEPALNVDLSLVDIFGLSTAFQTNPANYKFTNITQPLITVTTPVNPDQYAFWDDVHPTTRLHQLVTDTFETTLLNDGVIPDLIKYSATLADGSNLPDWLNFNSTTRTFSGTPNTGNVGKLDVKVIATDKAGATVNDIFTLAVNQSTTVGTPGDDKLIATPGSQFDGQNNIVFTGAGKDEVDLSTVSAFPNSGNNIVDLGSGEDTIFVNKGDRTFGSDGNDTFDARDGQGNNRMSGGLGNDTFFLGSNDRALGGDGNDIFRVSLGGGNLISGGAGADQFWIVNAELPKAANTVLDFQLGIDVIGIQGAVSLGITTSTLKLNQVGGDTAIVFNNQTLATLTGIQASSLSLTDPKQFVFA